MFHLAGFGGAKTASTANQNVPAMIDNALVTSANNRFISPTPVQVFAAMVANDLTTRARITAPSLRQEGLPEIFPFAQSNVQQTNPLFSKWGTNGPMIQANEEFGIELSNGASLILFAQGWLAIRDRFSPVPAGKRMSIFATSVQTLAVNAWTLGTLVLDQVLPYGSYAVIGMSVVCTSAYAARLVFPQGGIFRPGCCVSPTVGGTDFEQFFRFGKQGEWGRFPSIAQPQLELAGTTAGAQTASVYLDLVKLSA